MKLKIAGAVILATVALIANADKICERARTLTPGKHLYLSPYSPKKEKAPVKTLLPVAAEGDRIYWGEHRVEVDATAKLQGGVLAWVTADGRNVSEMTLGGSAGLYYERTAVTTNDLMTISSSCVLGEVKERPAAARPAGPAGIASMNNLGYVTTPTGAVGFEIVGDLFK